MYKNKKNPKFGIYQLDKDISLLEDSLILLKQSEHSNNHQLFFKILKSQNKSFSIFSDEINKISIPPQIKTDNEQKQQESQIAWRYKRSQFYDDVNEKKYDLTEIEYEQEVLKIEKFLTGYNESNCTNTVNELENNIKNLKLEENSDGALLISMFCPIFYQNNNNINIKELIIKNLFELRKKAKENNLCLFVSIPCFLYSELNINWEIYFDFVLELGEFEEYNGSIIMQKGGFNKYGFYVKSKGIEIEHLNIQPADLIEDDDKKTISDEF